MSFYPLFRYSKISKSHFVLLSFLIFCFKLRKNPINEGKIVEVNNEIRDKEIILELLTEKNPKSVVQCAEIAFGANSKAGTIANPEGNWREEDNPLTEKEKRWGTMHIAFGNSKHGAAEGHTESNVHLDFVIPRNGLTVEKFTSEKDYEKQKNGVKLINQGSWNLL